MFATFVPHFILLYDVFRWIGITGKYSNTLCICAKKCIMKQGITESRTQIAFCGKQFQDTDGYLLLKSLLKWLPLM